MRFSVQDSILTCEGLSMNIFHDHGVLLARTRRRLHASHGVTDEREDVNQIDALKSKGMRAGKRTLTDTQSIDRPYCFGYVNVTLTFF